MSVSDTFGVRNRLLESILEKMGSKQRCYSFSEFYNFLVPNLPENSHYKLNVWMEDLDTDITMQHWKLVCIEAHKESSNAQLRLLEYKWLIRTCHFS